MSYIKVTLDHPIEDGERLTFKAPINSTAATGIKVYYPVNNGEAACTMTSAVFTIIDACGTSLQQTASVFTAGAYVSVLLDTTNRKAYMLNNNIHIAAYDTAIAALQTAVANGLLHIDLSGVDKLLSWLPLSDQGFTWLLPSIAGGIIGGIIWKILGKENMKDEIDQLEEKA